MDKPRIIKGGVAIDDRGVVTFCNDFDMSEVKRFYMLENHQDGFVRAWHGHKYETKWVIVLSGVAVVCVAEMLYDLGGIPISMHHNIETIKRFVLHPNGDVLHIPAGYANGHMNLVQGTRVMHFSDKTLEEVGDEVMNPRYSGLSFNRVWRVKPR